MLDVGATMTFKNKSDVALKLASFLLFSAFKNNDKFGLILFSDKIHSFIVPKKGRKHLLRIIREILLAFENKNYQTKSNIKLALDFLNSSLKKHSICFLLSDDISCLNTKSAKQALKISNYKNDFVYFKIYDDLEKKIPKNFKYTLNFYDKISQKQAIFDFFDSDFVKKYNKIRKEKWEKEKKLLRQNKIDYALFTEKTNIYKNLLIFFKYERH